MVHLSIVPATSRDRARRARELQFVAAATAIVREEGPEGLTMVRLAERCDCAVGTVYGYFPSKAALLTAVVGAAVDRLRRSEHAARAHWERYLEERDVGEGEAALVRLVAHGAFVVAATMTHPHEVAMTQVVLGGRGPALDDDLLAGSLDALEVHLEEPSSLLRGAVGADVLDDGDATQRAVQWVAALNGVLLVEPLAEVAPLAFRAPHLARALTADLLVAWGADRALVASAGRHVERLAALTPLAPEVED